MDGDFNIRFLGPVQFDQSNVPVRGLRSRKAVAFLGYIAACSERVSRTQLAALFWPEFSETRALSNLSWIMAHLNSCIPACIIADRYTVRFQPSDSIKLDLAIFRQLIARGDPASLAGAVDLYRGEFMQDFYLNGCPEFETWLLYERERWQQSMIQALETLILHERNRGAYRQALPYASRLLQLDPCREEAHRYMMSLLALDGQRSAALAQYDMCRRILQDELNIEPSEETAILYKQIRDGTPTPQAPQPVSTFTVHSNAWQHLPSLYTPFVGREREVTQLIEWLSAPGYRFITITGPGGIGKTRLAMHVGEQLRSVFQHGVCVVPLASVEEASALVFAVADALKFSFVSNTDPKIQLFNALATKEVLLILDNFEHLLDGGMLLLDILYHAPQVKFLVTSRERLHLQAEYLFPLEGLALPNKENGVQSGHTSAVQLFLERAQRVDRTFQLSAHNNDQVVEICRLVEGNPLGIELAATWVDRLSLADIMHAIQTNIDMLVTTMRDIPERHRSMRAVFEGSWKLLSPSEQRTLAQLAIFRGGFSQEAALAITDASMAQLITLEHKSLLRRTTVGHYQLHELICFYAEEALSQLSSTEASLKLAVRRRHSDFYLRRVTALEAVLNGSTPQEAISDLRGDLDNIRQAWNWAIEQSNFEGIARSLNGLTRFYLLSCLYSEAEQMFGNAAEQIKRQYADLAPLPAHLDILLGNLWAQLTCFFVKQSRYDEAIALAQQVVKLAQRYQANDLEALSRVYGGEALMHQGHYEECQRWLEHARTLAHDLSLRQLEANCLHLLSIAMVRQSNYREAQRYTEMALQIYSDIHDRVGESIALNFLGIAAWYMGDFSTARASHELCLRNCSEIGNQQEFAAALHNYADSLWPDGDFLQAKSLFEQAFQIWKDVGHRAGMAVSLLNLGRMYMLLGDYVGSKSRYIQAQQLAHEVGIPWIESLALTHIGLLAHYQGNNAQAYDYCQQGLVIAQTIGGRSEQATALCFLGHALSGLERWTEASEAYQRALSIRYDLGQYHLANEVLAGMARLAMACGETAQALGSVEAILQHLERGWFAGSNEPMRIYLTCAVVLHENHDARAHDLVNRAHVLLEEQVAKISDPYLQHSFTEQIAVHRALQTLRTELVLERAV